MAADSTPPTSKSICFGVCEKFQPQIWGSGERGFFFPTSLPNSVKFEKLRPDWSVSSSREFSGRRQVKKSSSIFSVKYQK